MKPRRVFRACDEIARSRGEILAEKIWLAHQAAGEVVDTQSVLFQFSRQTRGILETSLRGVHELVLVILLQTVY